MSTRQPGFNDNGNCIFCGAQGKQPAKYDGTETFSIWCSNPECIVSHPSFREQVGHKVTHRKFAVLALLPVICLVVAMVWWTNNNFAKQEPPATLRQQQVVEARPSVPERPTPAPPKQQQAIAIPSQPSQPQPVAAISLKLFINIIIRDPTSLDNRLNPSKLLRHPIKHFLQRPVRLTFFGRSNPREVPSVSGGKLEFR